MTQTVDSQMLKKSGIEIRTYNFLDIVVEPPAGINEDELIEQIIKFEKDVSSQTVAAFSYQEDDWLFSDEEALHSVEKGLSEKGTINRGSFAKYVE